MFSTDHGRRRRVKLFRCSVGLLIAASAATWVGAALGQTCPQAHSACDNGGCCPSADQCCPTLAEGCCSSSTPYCCGDGTCAASPSRCGAPGATRCEGYDVPCGEGCAPAGADCCDNDGHYCPPESMCGSETTCLTGEDPSPALLVMPPAAAVVSRERAASPVTDPASASGRSCALSGGARTPSYRGSEASGFGVCLLGAIFWLRRRGHTRLAGSGERG